MVAVGVQNNKANLYNIAFLMLILKLKPYMFVWAVFYAYGPRLSSKDITGKGIHYNIIRCE